MHRGPLDVFAQAEHLERRWRVPPSCEYAGQRRLPASARWRPSCRPWQWSRVRVIRKSIVCGMSSEGNIGRGYRVPISGGDFGMGVRTPTARNDPPPTHHQDCRERAESTQISHSRQSATRGFSAKSQRQVTGNVGEYTETFEHHSCGDLSLTHLVRAQQERLRDRKPERLRGVEIDHQFELRGLLNRK
jgi:hypothetical protein